MIIRPTRLRKLGHYILSSITLPVFSAIGLPPLGLAISTGLILNAEIDRLKLKYIINENELSYEEGIINKLKMNIKLSNIIKIKVKKNLIERLLNYGDIIIETQTTPMILKNVRNPELIAKRIRELQSDV